MGIGYQIPMGIFYGRLHLYWLFTTYRLNAVEMLVFFFSLGYHRANVNLLFALNCTPYL